ncbi:hypothetical protein QYM36_018801 [Artemia franciscana]|uniref:Endonuclease/exonuclease/phosphatase domain-containing protein n=1 Tax=Artemia franciscana TaxID=6661 RepID=A0AA88H1W4_ARTSF|nr:hypothetical protein QYM36_018801 [Artemia franciscana]
MVINRLMRQHKERYKFADDLSLGLLHFLSQTSNRLIPVVAELQHEADQVKLQISLDKSSVVHVNFLKKKSINESALLQTKRSVKILGTILSNNLSFGDHISQITAKAAGFLKSFANLRSETYHILYSGLETRKEAGVGMALSSRAKKCLVDWEPINERILCARFATSQAKLTVIVVYAPTNDTVDQTKDDFYRVLSNVVAKAHRHDIVTLCGDFNAKVGSDASYAPAILGKHGLGEINDNGVRVLVSIRILVEIEEYKKISSSGYKWSIRRLAALVKTTKLDMFYIICVSTISFYISKILAVLVRIVH